MKIPFHGGLVTAQMFWDSDFGKVIETAAYCLQRTPNPELERKVDHVIELYGRLQQPDGYLSSWYQRIQPGLRWTNLRDCHELYCAGHLIEAAVAYFQATGKRQLLDIMCRFMDHIAERARHRRPARSPAIAAMRRSSWRWSSWPASPASRNTWTWPSYFIDERGRQPHFYDAEAREQGRDPQDYIFKTYEYNQSHLPVREQDKVVGHAVRAMYLYSGMADIAMEYGDDGLRLALERLWRDLTSKRLYVTGGLGPSADNEGFTADYDLPNESAYAETCAAVGLVFWAGRMLGLGPDARYADMMELALYNGALLRPVAGRRHLLLREPAGEPRRASSLDLAPLPLLPTQHRPADRLDRQLYVRPVRGRHRRPSLWRQHRHARRRRRQGAAGAGDALSVGRRHRPDGRAGGAGQLHPASAHPRLVPEGDAVGERTSRRIWRRSPATAMPRSPGAGRPATR